MIKNKGFTLVELIGVVVILGLISLIAIPTVTTGLKKYKESLYSDSIKNIEQAAKNWGAENIGKLPNDTSSNVSMTYPNCVDTESNYSTLYISVEQLAKEGFISDEIKNPKDNNLYCNKAFVTIKKTTSGYVYILENNDNGIETLELDQDACAQIVDNEICE